MWATVQAVLYHTYTLPLLLLGNGCMAFSCLSVLHLQSGTNYIGHDRSQFTDGYIVWLAVPTVIPPGLPYTLVHMAVHSIVEHPNQEGDTLCCARTTKLMAESVYGGDIQSIVTDH